MLANRPSGRIDTEELGKRDFLYSVLHGKRIHALIAWLCYCEVTNNLKSTKLCCDLIDEGVFS